MYIIVLRNKFDYQLSQRTQLKYFFLLPEANVQKMKSYVRRKNPSFIIYCLDAEITFSS